jgi:predicted ATPase
LAEQQPLLFILEDLHWTDPTTLEFLGLVIDQVSTTSILLFLTTRPEFNPPWGNRSYLTQITLSRLSSTQIERLAIQAIGGKSLPAEVVERILQQTDGVPLFVEEMTKSVLASGILKETNGHYELVEPLTSLTIPVTLQDSLMARLDRLHTAKGIAQMGAIIGRQFTYELLRAIVPVDETVLQRELRLLVDAELLYQRGVLPHSIYLFKHALIQDAAYQSLLRRTRQEGHQRIVQVLETQFQDSAESQPELLAHHSLRGEVWEKALVYYHQAGNKARAHSANREAVTCLEQALDALKHLPESRDTMTQGLDLRLEIHPALTSLGEFGRMLDYLREAETLAETLDDERRLAWITCRMTNYFFRTGDSERAVTCGQRALALATGCEDRALQVTAPYQLSVAYLTFGDYVRAIELTRQIATSLDSSEFHERFGMPGFASVFSRMVLSRCLGECGAFVEGRIHGEEGLRIAEAANHPDSLVRACENVSRLYLCQGDFARAILLLERGLSLCQERHIPVVFPSIAAQLGYVYALCGRLTEAVSLLEQAVERGPAMQVMSWHALWVAYLSETYLLADRLQDASDFAGQALRLSRHHKERGHEAYVQHLVGKIIMHKESPDFDQTETHYQQALALANELGMRPLQAHCHRDLGKLYRQTGQAEQARAELSTAIEMYREMEMTFWLPETEAALAAVEGKA